MNKSSLCCGVFGISASMLGANPSARAQETLAAPPSWKSEVKTDGSQVFTPSDLQAGEVYRLAVYPSQPLDGKALEDWLKGFAGPVGQAPGKLKTPLKVTTRNGSIVSGIGTYKGPGGAELAVVFVGVSTDGRNIHALRVLLNSDSLSERYKEGFGIVLEGLAARAKREAGMYAVPIPAKVTSLMTRGGKLTPGVYVGNQYYGDELRRRLRVYLYPGGEYRVCDHNDKDLGSYNTGTASYNPNTGQISIDQSYDLVNNSIPSLDDYCFYGQGPDGKPLIYAENDAGFNTYRTTLRYAGAGTRPAPSAEKAAKAAAEAEASRYKWVTAPGQGVKLAQIAAVLHYGELAAAGGSIDEEVYLLLKDGTVHSGLPVPPDEINVTRSRQKEPASWGRWRFAKGQYQVSWDGAPYQPLKGDKVTPGTAGQKLQGRWSAASSSGTLMGFGSYSFWGVTLNKEGRFSKDRRGGSSSGTIAQTTPGMASVTTAYDDDGSYVSATTDSVGVTSSRKGNPRADREGAYSISGYTLTLRYDNGKVARLPFFFISSDRKLLYFEGNQMSLDDKK